MSAFSASSETVAGYLVRVHPGGGRRGDPYVAACLVVPDGTTAEVRGFVVRGGGYGDTAAAIRAVEAHLRDLGFTRMRYERFKGGKVVPFVKEL